MPRTTILYWRSSGVHHTKLRKHVAISTALVPLDNSRFLVEEAWMPDGDYYYRIRDASKVSDAEIRAGKATPTVHTCKSPDEALRAIRRCLAREYLIRRKARAARKAAA